MGNQLPPMPPVKPPRSELPTESELAGKITLAISEQLRDYKKHRVRIEAAEQDNGDLHFGIFITVSNP